MKRLSKQKDQKKLIYDEVKKNLKKYGFGELQFFLFGSRAKGVYNDNSDWDIGVDSQNQMPFMIYNRIKGSFLEDGFDIDFVDFSRVDKDFKKLAMKHIVYFG